MLVTPSIIGVSNTFRTAGSGYYSIGVRITASIRSMSTTEGLFTASTGRIEQYDLRVRTVSAVSNSDLPSTGCIRSPEAPQILRVLLFSLAAALPESNFFQTPTRGAICECFLQK